ncbi:hypothetical protein GCM10022223_61350 [Kineosporia mesophila]|uniref:Uncharacterized protein n=1 Tax=Kineosporia mesophila TaxID=566012 RepID=A0ABP7AK99_9ACTN|nr:hypothetical protein [Kineosporia mesophila]MCD5354051.1 hypothetical protein [Kineosporia mesophila]
MLGADRWNQITGTTSLTAREYIALTLPLLQGTIEALSDLDREVLADQVRTTLALGTRESTMPLRAGLSRANDELLGQAESIGQEIAEWAVEALDQLLADRSPFPAGPLVVRSHCYGETLTRPAAELLLGRRGGPVAMQNFNEWIHQTVLLRDALLPFTNWQQVPVHVTPLGLRHLEPAREQLFAEAMFRKIRHTTIVGFAQQVVTGESRSAGYGFDHNGATVLPVVTAAPVRTAPRYLLSWSPSKDAVHTATYVSELADYYAAPRTTLSSLPPATASTGARLVAGPVIEGVRRARIETGSWSVDLGQALRGHRYARSAPDLTPEPDVSAASALAATGLVVGNGAIDTAGLDELSTLALLGRTYPEKVTLRPDAMSLDHGVSFQP